MKTFEEKILELNLSDTDRKNLLRAFCDKKHSETLTEFLNIYGEKIDITFDDGELFRFAIAWEHTEVLSTLIDYYQKTQLNDLNKENLAYNMPNINLRSL